MIQMNGQETDKTNDLKDHKAAGQGLVIGSNN